MKKLIILAMIGMITMTMYSCSNDQSGTSSDYTNQTHYSKKTSAKGEDTSKEEQAAIDLVKSSISGKIVPGNNPYNTEIMCHTDYLQSSGSACVYSGGYMFQVTWGWEYVRDQQTGQMIDQEVWHSTSVHSCNC